MTDDPADGEDGEGAVEAGDPPGPDAADRSGDGETKAADGADPGTEGAGEDGPVDFAWVMQATFVGTIVFGAPLVAVLSAFVVLPTWESRVGFAARVGAVVWILTALSLYGYDRWVR